MAANTMSMPLVQWDDDVLIRTVLDGLPEPVIAIGHDYHVLFANKAAMDNFSLPASRGTQKCYQFSHHQDVPCDGDKHPCPLQLVIATNSTARVIHEHFSATGEPRKIELLASPLRDASGNVVGIIESAHDVTNRIAEHEALQESEEKLRLLFNTGDDAIYVYRLLKGGRSGKFVEVNDRAAQMLGYSRDELLAMSPDDIDITGDSKGQNELTQELMSGQSATSDRTYRAKDGTIIPVEINARIFQFDGKRAVLLVVRDISKRKQTELEYKTAIQTAKDGFLVVDSAGRLIDTNEAYCALLGYTRNELLRLRVSDVEAIESPEENQRHAIEIRQQGHMVFETRHRRKNGQVIDVEVSTTFLDSRGGLLITFIRDITERKQSELRIRQLAFYDSLTNLPNRRLLLDRFELAMSQAQRFHRSLAIMFLDLDHFKEVNDTLGHAAGDELLKQVARRLIACTRAGDTVSRSGGDEFLILLSEIRNPQDASLVAEKVLSLLESPIPVHGESLRISASIGIVLFSGDSNDNIETLMKKADQAMYEAKAAGRNCYRYYRDLTQFELDM